MIKFLRNFVAVGQGGFSIERFYVEDKVQFCAVYDCGSASLKKRALTKTINEHFNKNDHINALFISHFDNDHINGITTLIKNFHVDKIFLPVLSKSQKIILNVIKRDKETLSFINDPIKYLSKTIDKKYSLNIYFVKQSNDGENDENDIYDNNIDGNINIEYIDSGSAVYFNELVNIHFWEYIPYNICFSSYNNLNKEIVKICGKLKLKEILKDSKKIKEIHDAYKRILNLHKIQTIDDDNQNNLNSLILYSGPSTNNYSKYRINEFCTGFFRSCINYTNIFHCSKIFKNCFDFKYYNLFNVKVGCLYFGDSDAKDVRVQNIMNIYNDRIAFIQVPHHGSKYNNDDFILKKDVVYIIFAGAKNTNNHPSEIVIEKLNIYDRIYYIVTEYRESELLIVYNCC